MTSTTSTPAEPRLTPAQACATAAGYADEHDEGGLPMQSRPNDTAPWEMEDGLIDPMDDGTIALAPGQFDPLCEVKGGMYPANAVEAAEVI